MNQNEIKKIAEDSLLKANYKFESPPTCLEISGQYGNQIFATLGNFSTILAAPKVGKTTATGIIVSALLSAKQYSNFIPSLPDNQKNVVWIDTEQGIPECLKIIQSISKQTTGNKTEMPENFIFSSLRKHSKDIRIEVIEYIIYNTPNIGVLVIDGIRDLVSSINDEREATSVADKLLKWSSELNIHILTVLHQNKADKNARGHLGTELMNKAETVATLNRGENNGNRITFFEPKLTRHKEFEPFAFAVDENGVVGSSEAIVGSKVKDGYDSKSPKADELTFIEITAILKGLFPTNGESYTYAPLETKINEVCNEMFEHFGMNKCTEVLKMLKSKNYIMQKTNSKVYEFNKYPL